MAEVVMVPSAREKIVFILMCFSSLLHAELKSSHYGWKTTKTTHNIISIDSSCTRDYMDLRIGFSSPDGSPPFRGAIHAKGFPNECRSQANASETSVTFLDLRVPAESCGIRVLRKEDGQQAYQVEVDVQFDRNLQQSVDQSHVVTCVIPFDDPRRGQTDAKRENATHGTRRHSFRSGRKESSWNERRSSGNINAWMEVRGVSTRRRGGGGGGKHASTTQHHRQQQYFVGEQLTMTVKSFIGSGFGARVVNCTAHDGRVNGPEQRLLDGRGCPIDVGIMPAPTTHRRNVKQNGNPTAKDKSFPSYEAATSFLAFKFPDRDFLHLRCWLQICKEFCRQANCNVHRESYEAMMEEQDENEITRLEVFNSFSVKAPGIESDASEFGDLSRKDFVGYVEDNSVGPGSSGRLLCMSPSRLALAFAFIGLVFLAAIAISVYVCLRSRRREDMKARLLEHPVFFPYPPSPPSLSRSSSNVSFLSRARTPCPYFPKASR